jgi:hypothetical protein
VISVRASALRRADLAPVAGTGRTGNRPISQNEAS